MWRGSCNMAVLAAIQLRCCDLAVFQLCYSGSCVVETIGDFAEAVIWFLLSGQNLTVIRLC